jgi:flap endonuclease-1
LEDIESAFKSSKNPKDKEKLTEIQDIPYDEIREIFLNPPKIEISAPEWSEPKSDELRKILCAEHDFSESRVQKSIERLKNALEELRGSTQQSSLSDFF